MSNSVEVEGIVKRYDSTVAVDGLDFTVEEGNFFSLLGPSGCGKTTTLRCIAGLERPDSGRIEIDGSDMTNVPAYERNIGMVFQGYALFPHKTVAENVGFGLKMRGVDMEERRARISDALELVNLPGFQERNTTELSGGQQQRVALARALVIEPSVLLLDEPLSNLDLKLRKEMRFELLRIQEELGITTIYVTHDQEEALSMSDRILVMNDGEVEQIGSPVEIYNEPANSFVADFIGEINQFEATIEAVENGHYTVSLDDIRHDAFTVAAESSPGSFASGERVNLSLRPENVSLRQEPSDAPNRLSGTVSTKTFHGRDTQLLIRLPGDADEDLLVQTPGMRGQREFDTGDDVVVEWTPKNCLLTPGVER